MRLRLTTTLLFIITLSIIWNNSVYGVSRSKGIGVRGGTWRIKSPKNISFGGVSSSGGCGSLYFFSRYNGDMFFEASIGGVGNSWIGGGIVESESLVPVLFGVRYDLFPSMYGSTLRPYIGTGAGAYSVIRDVVGQGVQNENNTEVGFYAASGINIMLSSRFAINGDIKYHLVDINTESGREYQGFQLEVGFSYMWGRQREIFRIQEIRVIVKDIYPAYYQFYSTYPLAQVSVKNMVSYPIEINIRSHIKGYSERSMESGFVPIERGKIKNIDVFALFGPKLLQTSRREPAVLDLELEARAGAIHTKSVSAQVIIHNRNAWNGEIDRLVFFVTPDDENILEVSRKVMNKISDIYEGETKHFLTAKALFNELKKLGIRYQNDPNIPFYKDDRVQFAAETIELGTGDCDDLVVLYSSLLESIGIKTAFVDVQDPEKEIAHVYLIFDSGVSIEKSGLITNNEKRFVVREKSSYEQTLWIPLETTLVEQGFNEAWKSGALQYLQEGILRNGISEGWVKIIDVE